MKKTWRPMIAVIGVAVLMVQMMAGPVAMAGEISSTPATLTLPLPEITLEKAIQIVKTNFVVPNEYKDFHSSYNTNDDRQVWSLRWNGSVGLQGEFGAEVSAQNGDIVSMNYWKGDSPSTQKGVLPTITKLGAQEISTNLLTRLLGERAGQLRLVPSDQMIVPISNYGPTTYSFQYQRIINEVPFLSNGVNVQVSSTDGQITAYNLKWNEVKAPEVKGVIDVGQAQKAFAAAPFFNLEYWVPSSYRPLTVGQKQEVKLVYQLKGPSGGAIDAYTGEALQLNQGEWLATDSLGYGGMGSAKEDRAGSTGNAVQVLTPQEQQEVERNAKLLKQDEAITAVKRWISIPDNLSLRGANLSTDWRSPDKSIWNFEWNVLGSDKGEGLAQQISARVSATTGELFGFNTYYQQTGKTEAKLDRAATQKIAEEFLKRVQPNRFSEVTLESVDNANSKMVPEPWNTQYFSYFRVVNGINFPYNGMNIQVDPVAGKVIGYDLNWSEYNLPGVSGILSKDKAVESFVKARPLTLTYVRIYSNGVPGNLRLVYLPIDQKGSMPLSNILDAKSGELLDFQGQPLTQGPKPFTFIDLAGVNGAPEITALGQAGLFGDFENSFKPLDKMSLASLLRAMYLNRFGLSGNTSLTEGEILAKAKEQGWLKEDLQPGDPVTRELLVKLLLRYIQLNKVAELKDIYQVNFEDAAQISSDALGYIALAKSTGILKVEGQVLAPKETVSRAEAATALFRALGWLR